MVGNDVSTLILFVDEFLVIDITVVEEPTRKMLLVIDMDN